MEKESFTYTICSTEYVQIINNQEYYIDIGGFGSKFNNFHIEVLNCIVNQGVDPADGFLILVASDFGSSGVFCQSKLPSNETVLCTVATNDDVLMSNGGISFRAENLRMKRRVRFKWLLPTLENAIDDVDINLNGILTSWMLTLKVTPID